MTCLCCNRQVRRSKLYHRNRLSSCSLQPLRVSHLLKRAGQSWRTRRNGQQTMCSLSSFKGYQGPLSFGSKLHADAIYICNMCIKRLVKLGLYMLLMKFFIYCSFCRPMLKPKKKWIVDKALLENLQRFPWTSQLWKLMIFTPYNMYMYIILLVKLDLFWWKTVSMAILAKAKVATKAETDSRRGTL